MRFPIGEPGCSLSHEVPPLLKGYMRSGAWICGEPAWDPAFHCADLFLLMPLANLNDRYARRYIAEKP